MRGRRARLVTVWGPGGVQDLVVSADASLVALLPVLIELLGGGEQPPSSPRWALYTEDGRVLPTTATLTDARVVDGQVLVLSTRRPGANRPGEVAITRTAEARTGEGSAATWPEVSPGPGAGTWWAGRMSALGAPGRETAR
jgi:hypothetical protein